MINRHAVSPDTAFGDGNMATAMVGGLISNHFRPDAIIVSEPSNIKTAMLAERFGIRTTTCALAAVEPGTSLGATQEK